MSLVFGNVDQFFEWTNGKIVLDEAEGNEGYHTHRRVLEIEGDRYELLVEQSSDCEGSCYLEEWRKEGRLHRAGNHPAVVRVEYHSIPEETHLDRSVREFYLEGKYQDMVDTTYEDIVSSKPLAVQQYAGWYVD